jgi:hypothetical protein
MPLSAMVLALVVSACGHGERSFLEVQFCLSRAAGIPELRKILQQIARDEHMDFTDRSAATEAELRDMKEMLTPEVLRSFPIINMSMRRGAVGLGGGNLGLGPDQVALGFGPDTPEGRAFATRAVHRLQENWRLVHVPANKGAFPLKECSTT